MPFAMLFKRSGQSVTEFILMFAFLTLIGVWIMNVMIGPEGDSGALRSMQEIGATTIANEPD